VVEIVEDRLVQELVAHAAVEGLADAVLHRLAGGDEVPVDAARERIESFHRLGLEPAMANSWMRLARRLSRTRRNLS
jgi:hypothetical protein